MLSNRFIKIGENKFRVYDFVDTNHLDYGFAYVLHKDSPYVLPYRGEIMSFAEAYAPGIYMYLPKHQMLVAPPFLSNNKEEYSVDNIEELSPDDIFKKLSWGEENDKVVAHNPEKIFIPEVNDNDDMFLKLMKYGVALKKMDLDAADFGSTGEKNNRKRLFKSQRKLNPDMGVNVGDAMGIGVGFFIYDSDGASFPMNGESKNPVIHYTSSTGIDLANDNVIFNAIDVSSITTLENLRPKSDDEESVDEEIIEETGEIDE